MAESAVPRGLPLSIPLVPLVALLAYGLLPEAGAGPGLSEAGRRTTAMAVWMAGWWLFEPVPLAATALLPLVLFPVLGILKTKDAAAAYGDPLIFLFMGGFMMANALERWGLHRRIALRIVGAVGTSPRQLVGGFLLAAAFVSMWVSNTATTVMLLPTGLSVIDLVGRRSREAGGTASQQDAFGAALVLAIGYGATIGGLATLIGTAPNALLAGFVRNQYGQTIGFVEWLWYGLPLTLAYLPFTWMVLTRWALVVDLPANPGGREALDAELAGLGPMSRAERWVAGVFVAASFAWVTRPWLVEAAKPYGLVELEESGIAILGALVLMLAPAGDGRGSRVLEAEVAERIPWGMLVMFGGGLSLAAAVGKNGVAEFLGTKLAGLSGMHPLMVMLVVAFVVVFLTELASNTAVTAGFLPIMAAVAVAVGMHPFALAFTTTFAASCGFMLPMGTPPNALAVATGRVNVRQMFRAGLWLNLLGIALIPVVVHGVMAGLLGLDLNVLPAWAKPAAPP